MAENTFFIELKDRDPLPVDKQMLVKSSRVFRYIIEECDQTEHDMGDFPPEIVQFFLTLLEDKKLRHLEDGEFRELHKIAVVFDVTWLIDSCRKWLIEKIGNVRETIEFDAISFLFEECYYIYNKWKVADLMQALILELRFQDKTLFLSRYLRENYDLLNDCQVKFLLYLAGTNTKVFLELIIERIENQEYLDDRTRYLLQHMNLKLCLDKDEKLYNQMSVRFSKMSRISFNDCKLVLKLITEATKEAADRKGNPSTTNVLYDGEIWRVLYNECESLEDITDMITYNDIENMHMYSVIDSLAVVASKNTFSTDQAEEFVKDLEKLQQSKDLKRVSIQYIDMLITALEFSTEEQKHQLIDLLDKIRNSETLTSDYDNIHLLGEKITHSTFSSKLKTVLGMESDSVRYVFKINYPEVTDCKKEGDCGFVISNPGFENKVELSREASDYTNSGVHVHEEFRPEDMYYYSILTGTTAAGDTVRVPIRGSLLGWRWGWLWGWPAWTWWWWSRQGVFDGKEPELCVDYNITDYLVAKY